MEESTKDKIQKQAFEAWKANNKIGVLEIITGLGKTKIFLEAVKELPSDAKILFLAETKEREHDLKQESIKWSCESCAPITFMCYQSAYKLQNTHWDLVCADEIHDSLTPIYSAFYFNNTYSQLMGLSATVDLKAYIDDTRTIRKGDLLKKIAPIVFTYKVDDGQRDGTSRKLNIYKIWHKLDGVDPKAVIVGTKAKPIVTSEELGYKICDNKFKQAMFAPEHIKTFLIRNASAKRADLLYKLPSKIKAVKKLCDSITSKSILFGNSLESLLKVTKNVVSSKNSDKENELIRKRFDSGKINLIGSFKKLKQGANLTDLDNCIIMSYYSKEKDLIQRVGRMRISGDLKGNVFIFVTRGTQEEVWFERMMENITSFDITEFQNVEECINHLKKEELCQ